MLRFYNAILCCVLLTAPYITHSFEYGSKKIIQNNIIEKEYEKNEIKNKLSKLNKELSSKKTTSNDYRKLSDQKKQLLLKKWENSRILKNHFEFNHKHHFSTKEKISINVSPSRSCESPCTITIEANVHKKITKKITKYIFNIDDKKIESTLPKVTTTLIFSKNLISKSFKKNPNSKAINIKFFKIQVHAETKNDISLASDIKRIAVKESKISLAVDLLTPSLMPMERIQIASNQFKTMEIKAYIGNLEIVFRRLNNDMNSNIMTAIMPYTGKDSVTLKVLNSEFKITILPLPQIQSPKTYVQEYMENTFEIIDVLTTNEKYTEAIGVKGINVFKRLKEPMVILKTYIQNYATPDEIQKLANLMNASLLADEKLRNLVSESNPDQNVFTVLMNKKNTNLLITNFISVMSMFTISSSYAQAIPPSPKDLLITEYNEKLGLILQEILTIGVRVMFDEMIHKCYIQKSRPVPTDVIEAEDSINLILKVSSLALTTSISDPTLVSAYTSASGYLVGLFSSAALIVRIGVDCEAGQFIVPVLNIKNQPAIAAITPGEVLNYDLKCDVGNERYYDPREILIKTNSFFEYSIPLFEPMSSLVTEDKIITGCSGLGRSPLSDSDDSHDVKCNTNLLEKTRPHQLNLDAYTTFNKSSCQENQYYEVGVNYFETPLLSCSFINTTAELSIPSKQVTGNQVEFNLKKRWNCPKASFTTLFWGFEVEFDAYDDFNKDMGILTYTWDFGDNTPLVTTTSAYLKDLHLYKNAGEYNVTLTIKDEFGATDIITRTIEILPSTDSFFVKVNPSGPYVHTDSGDKDIFPNYTVYPQGPQVFDLTNLYKYPFFLRPGDFIYILGVGDFKFGRTGTDTATGHTGVFSNGSQFLFPGPDSDYSEIVTLPSYAKKEPTDIPQDFEIHPEGYTKVRIPIGATQLITSALDENFANNTDPDNDFGMIIKFDVTRSSAD